MGSIWFESLAPPFQSDELAPVTDRTWDLVVVGGGIVGLLAALRARQHGRDVCLLEAGRVGEGTTAHATVKVTSGHGGLTAEIADRHGVAEAAAYQRANDAGFARLATIVASLPEDVGWVSHPHIVYATEAASVERLHATEEVARQAGSALSRCEPPVWASGEAWSWDASSLVQPLSLARALARVIHAAGVPVVEGARVIDVRDSDHPVRVRVEGGGEVRARDVLIASHSPIHDPDGHALRAEVLRHAAVAVTVPVGDVPSSYDLDGMSTRPVTLPNGERGAVVVGETRRPGSMTPDAWDRIREWSVHSFGGGTVTHYWGAQDVRSLDLLPYVGRTRRSPHVLVVTGLNGWGFTNAAAIADWLPGVLDNASSDSGDSPGPPWRADRVYPSGGLGDAAATMGWVGRSLVGDHVKALAPMDEELLPGEGRVVGGPLKPRAECITPDGKQHCVSARCTHIGCLVRWNATELSWDCPCHGSRFGPDGRVLEGPARAPLEPM